MARKRSRVTVPSRTFGEECAAIQGAPDRRAWVCIGHPGNAACCVEWGIWEAAKRMLIDDACLRKEKRCHDVVRMANDGGVQVEVGQTSGRKSPTIRSCPASSSSITSAGSIDRQHRGRSVPADADQLLPELFLDLRREGAASGKTWPSMRIHAENSALSRERARGARRRHP